MGGTEHGNNVFLKSGSRVIEGDIAGSQDFVVFDHSCICEGLSFGECASIKRVNLVVDPLGPHFRLLNATVDCEHVLDSLGMIKLVSAGGG